MQYIVMTMNHDDGDISLRPQDPYWMDMMHQVEMFEHWLLFISSGWEIDP